MVHSQLEVCIDSVAGAKAAQAAGACRVELCSGLVEGGITPSHGLIKQVRSCLSSTTLMVLVRPRGGDFVYSADEIQVMLADIVACGQLGAHGVALGCLKVDGQVDEAKSGVLVQAAIQQGLDVTFHRAFDMCRDLSEALKVLMTLGIPRVLTSGGQPSAVQGAETLTALVRQAAGRISIMAGGGVTSANAAALVWQTGVQEVHSSAKRRYHSPVLYRPALMTLCAPTPSQDYNWASTDQSEVTALLTALEALTSQS